MELSFFRADESKLDLQFNLMFNLNSQVRADFKSASIRNFSDNFKAYINKHWREDGTFKKMLVLAYGDGHEKGLDAETLQDLLDAGWFHTDHVFSCTGDDPENFILMPKTLNMKFSFHTEQDFKKEWTGDAWKGAEYLVRKAIHMQQRIHRH